MIRSPFVLFFLLLLPLPADAADSVAASKEEARARIERMLKETKTMTWDQKVWLGKGSDEERTAAKCFYQAPDMFRLNVSEGRGEGATVVFKDGKITAFKRGLLSFAKLTYKPRDKTVLSLRGGDITQTGFLDDLAYVIRQWDTVDYKATPAEWIVSYKDPQGLPAIMKIRSAELYPYRLEITENGKLVEIHNYSNVAFNAPLEQNIFNP